MYLQDINAPESGRTVSQMYQRLITDKHVLGETLHLSKDGRKIPVEINANLFELNGGQFVLSVARDITERKMAEANIQNQLQRLEALHTIDSAISSRLPLPALLTIILDQVVNHLSVKAADILLFDPEKRVLVYGQSKNFMKTRMDRPVIRLGEGLAGRIVAERCTMRVADLWNAQFTRKEQAQKEGFVSYQGAPLISKGKVLGVLEVFNNGELEDDPSWMRYFDTLAGQAAIAIEDSYMDEDLIRANQVLTQAYEETIEGWAHALDLRDHETEGHSRRVTDLSLRLSKAMGFRRKNWCTSARGAAARYREDGRAGSNPAQTG
jgi:transcriptional regulator with GAF, ATPase, and Fis domain